jgi:hypothetical protein
MYTCAECGEKYDTRQGLQCHSRSHIHDHIILTYTQRQIILGSLLGDMSIRVGNGQSNPRISAVQSTNQSDYLLWKYSALKNLTSSEPYIDSTVDNFGRISGKDGFGELKRHYSLRFQTMSIPCLLPIYKMVRGDGNKYVSKPWLNEIVDPIGLAVWYMDDGCLTNKYAARFALGSMSQEEQFAIQDWMLNRWDIDSTIFKQPNPVSSKWSYNIYSNLSISSRKSNLHKFKELVEPYIIPSMRYKIDAIG